MSTERERIDRMLAEGKITPDEAGRLKMAIERIQRKESVGSPDANVREAGNAVGRTGRIVPGAPARVMDKLRLLLAAANCEVIEASADSLSFRHGTYLTQSAPLLPTRGRITLSDRGDSTLVKYTINVDGFARYWMMFVAVVFCWAVFPPILVHRALVYHPRRFVENLLAGL